MSKSDYQVVVGNVGQVYSGKSELDARIVFKEYEAKSLANSGRAGNQEVVMLRDGEEYRRFNPPEILKSHEGKMQSKVKANPSRRGTVDEHAATELSLYANNEKNLYNRLQAFAKNYALKMRKGTYNKERAVDGLESMVGDVYRQYCKEYGKFPCSAATKRHAAEIILEGVEEDAEFMLNKVKANPSRRGTVDEHAATELSLYANNEKNLYNRLQAFAKNYALKMRKGTYNKERAVDGLESMVGDVYRQYCKEYGKFPCSAATKRHAAEIILEGVEEDAEFMLKHELKKNPSIKSIVKKISPASAKRVAKKITNLKPHLVSIHKKLKKNPPNEAGGMAAFEHDVIGNPAKGRVGRAVSAERLEAAREKGRLLAAKHKAKKFAASARAEAARERGRLLAAEHKKSAVSANPRRLRGMSMASFIKENKAEIDAAIKSVSDVRLNDKERRMWIMNDEGLYRWARSCGVRI